jgi:hypothetical protein
MSAKTYTQEQILSGIRIFWREELGYESPCHPDMNLVEQLKAEGFYEDLDFADVRFGLQRLFGFTCSWEEWDTFLGIPVKDPDEWEKIVVPRLTFRALAEFIREQLEPISFGPITLLGKPCLTAGVFRGLERLAVQVHPNGARFAPSTSIRKCLRRVRLYRFWCRLRWMLHDRLPPPPKIELHFSGCLSSLCFKLGIGLLIALWRRDLTGLTAGFVVSVVLLLPTVCIVEFINERLNPLPEGIETFGDLARVLAAIILDQQSECVSCSTP